MEKFFGFYTSRRFWGGNKIASDDIKDFGSQFTNLMQEVVFFYETDRYKLFIHRDGLISLQLKELSSEVNKQFEEPSHDMKYLSSIWSKYLDYLNCIQVLLESAVLEIMKIAYFEVLEITNKEALTLIYENDKFMGGGASDISHANKMLLERYSSSYTEVDFKLFHSSSRIEIPRDVFDRLNSDLYKLSEDYSNIKIISNITKSISEYKISNYDTSLILSWFVIESYIEKLWERLIVSKNVTYSDGSKRISSERKKHFSHNNYPISVKSNLLELFEVIDISTFKKIDSVRDFRNKIVHQNSDFKCSDEHCKQAFEIIKKIILSETGVVFNINESYSITF